jgi:glutamine amidotransferase
MSRKTIGIVDYGVGNHASIHHAFQALNYRCFTSWDPELLAESDLVVLPGVGAYPTAMKALHTRGLVGFLRDWARDSQPLIGLCLGMQLLADESYENGITTGLGLIPGQVVPLVSERCHVGWNTIEVTNADKLLLPSDRETVYFNHSYVFDAPKEYQTCIARWDQQFVAGVRRGKMVGLQFHPEKSQIGGRRMLRNLVEGLIYA